MQAAQTLLRRAGQLAARTAGEDILAGHGVRGGKAMFATLRWRLIAVPSRLIRHALWPGSAHRAIRGTGQMCYYQVSLRASVRGNGITDHDLVSASALFIGSELGPNRCAGEDRFADSI
jgi:hypothetical protein